MESRIARGLLPTAMVAGMGKGPVAGMSQPGAVRSQVSFSPRVKFTVALKFRAVPGVALPVEAGVAMPSTPMRRA